MKTKFLVGKDYPWLCSQCQQQIDTIAGMIKDLPDTDDNEAPCMYVCDHALFCGGTECKNKITPGPWEAYYDGWEWFIAPGCSLRDIESLSEIPQLRCNQCKSFIQFQAERIEQKQTVYPCNGKITLHECEYSEGLINILGEEYRNKTYKVYHSCDGEVSENTPDHEPHNIVTNEWTIEFRTCKHCGLVNQKVIS